MNEASCSQCDALWAAEELLQREDTGEMVCPACSGLVDDEDISCHYDETG